MTGPVTILDGGMGRHLEAMGAPFRQPEWSALSLLEAPDFVRRAHDDFLAAGADIITVNSYAVVPFHIGEDRFEADGDRLTRLAARLARMFERCTGRTPNAPEAAALSAALADFRARYAAAPEDARMLIAVGDKPTLGVEDTLVDDSYGMSAAPAGMPSDSDEVGHSAHRNSERPDYPEEPT